MATRFDIAIVGINRASPMLRAVRRDIQDFSKVQRGLVEVNVAARNVADGFARILPPVAALVGSGAIAALGAMIAQWVKAGIAVDRLAQVSGVSVSALQSLGGANAIVGGSAESMQASIANLGNTMQDAFFGRNPAALAMLRQLGINLKVTGNAANDAEAMFLSLSAAIVKLKTPAQQMLVARAFGLEEQLPLLQKGPALIQAWRAEYAKTGAIITNTKAVEEWQKQLTLLQGSVLGVRNSIVDQLSPSLLPLTQGVRDWIIANQELLGQLGIGLAGVSLAGSVLFLGRAIALLGSAVLLSPIGILTTTLVGAAYLVYTEWDRVLQLWRDLRAEWDNLGKPRDQAKDDADTKARGERTQSVLEQLFGGKTPPAVDELRDLLRRAIVPNQYGAPIGPQLDMPAPGPQSSIPGQGGVPRVEMPMPGPYSGRAASQATGATERTPTSAPVDPLGKSTPQQVIITFENLPAGWVPRAAPGSSNLGVGISMSPASP